MLDQVAMVMFPDLQQLNLLLSAKFVQGLLFMGTDHLEIMLQPWLQKLEWRLSLYMFLKIFYILYLIFKENFPWLHVVLKSKLPQMDQ